MSKHTKTLNETMWLNRYDGHKQGKARYGWAQVRPLRSSLCDRFLWVFDAERNAEYPVRKTDLYFAIPSPGCIADCFH